MNRFDLKGRTAFITGGNGGIGLAMARALGAAGASVAIAGSNAERNADAQRLLTDDGSEAMALVCDVSNEEAVEAAVGTVIERLGSIDACFVNAGIGQKFCSFHELDTAEWRRVMAVNLDGAFFTCRAVLRHMVERGDGGSIVLTSSLAVFSGQQYGEAYGASKGALVSLMRALAVEYGRHGVRVNAVLPGWTDTAMTHDLLHGEPFQRRVLPRVPLGRWGDADDMAGIAVYLASDASSYHSGDVLLIDGGYSVF